MTAERRLGHTRQGAAREPRKGTLQQDGGQCFPRNAIRQAEHLCGALTTRKELGVIVAGVVTTFATASRREGVRQARPLTQRRPQRVEATNSVRSTRRFE
jgi:hypothetical protein